MTLKEFKKIYITETKIISSFRIYNTRSMILFYLLGLKLSNSLNLNQDTFKISLALIFSYAFASLINYREDVKIDNENKKYNPFIENKYLKNEISLFTILFILFSLILCITTGKVFNFFGIGLILFLGYAYSKPPLKFSHNPLAKILSMSLTYVYIPSFMGITSGNSEKSSIIFILILGTIYASWLPYGDIKDIRGDQKYKKSTLAILLGVKKLTAVCFLLSLTCISFLFFQQNYLKFKFPPLVMMIILIIQLFFIFKPYSVSGKIFSKIGGYFLIGLLLLFIFR